MVYAVSPERFRTFEALLAELTSSQIGDKSVLPNGVRHLFALDGSYKVTDIDDIEEGESYVCASTAVFKNIDYPMSTTPVWNPNVRSLTTPSRERTSSPGPRPETPGAEETRDFIKPKLVTIIRNGTRPRKAVRILLNKKTAHSFDQVIADISDAIKLDSGPVKKIFTIDGKLVRYFQIITELFI
jgi:doublecortin-like kinase 1/2